MKKVGILGGGQLGRMLLQVAANYPVETYILEKDEKCPSAHLCEHFIKGDIANFEDVYNFGKNLDVITIEIESVNIDALIRLEEEGVTIYPNTAALAIIKNKILQKEFYKLHGIPSAPFVITQSAAEIRNSLSLLPAVHKAALGGYDGKGVEMIRTEADIPKGFQDAAVLEKMVDIKKELAIIIAINEKGETAIYPAVEMIFDKDLHLLDYQLSPAAVTEKTLWKAEAIALSVVKNLKSPGIFAVELFVDLDDNVLVNETAPRVHNSGHHTIEGNFSSQFDMLWRILLGLPLGNPSAIMNSAIINLIGEENHSGIAIYQNLDEVLSMDSAFVHIYGKRETRPGRKMGHVTVLGHERQHLIHLANKIKQTLKVVSQ